MTTRKDRRRSPAGRSSRAATRRRGRLCPRRNNMRVEIGLGIDQRLGLTPAQLRDLAAHAKALGYQSMWTNASPDYDPVVMCAAWYASSGLRTGISVAPITRNPA